MRRIVFLRALALLLLAGPHAACASSLTVLFGSAGGSTENTGATVKLTFSFSAAGADDRLNLLLENTTPPAIGATLTAVGFELPPALNRAPVFAAGGNDVYFDVLTFDEAIAPGWLDAPGGYDLMLTSDGNFEGGNAHGGLTAGASASVVLSLGDTNLTPSELHDAFSSFYQTTTDRFAVARFQQVGPAANLSDKVGGYIPEPATAVLLALGALSGLARARTHTRWCA